ncbi:G-protein coupled receptor 182 [Silurus asotus]|uniref:G-protein coupled receptor 182 n=1 Tax=Silurus asotus TaxID=30991 RepID=A0AAD5A3Z9_SILAS|nr:G-protein coupled receptor 182 [Silurus asotus]
MMLDNSTSGHHNDTLWLYECNLELDRESRRIALFLLYLLLFMAGLVENCLVVWVNWRRRHSASGVLFCVINISLSDLMVVFTMPFFMLEVTMDKVWIWGRFLCKVTHLIYVINFYSSSFFLAFMTLERYLTITRPTTPACFPLQPRHRRWLLCAGVWLLSLFLALLENVHVDLLEWSEPGCYMMPELHYIAWYVSVSFCCLIFQFLGPASVIITCNILIARAVRASPEVQNRRDIWLLHVYSLVFVVCWLPYHIVMFLMMVDDLNSDLMSCNTVDILYYAFSVVQCISLLHCIANPILYNFLSKNFRANLYNDILSRISAAPANSAAGGAGTASRKERKLSNASTSHSEIGP